MPTPPPDDPTGPTVRRPIEPTVVPRLSPAGSEPTVIGGTRADDAGSAPAVAEGRAFGRYRLLQELGRGGMGVVWKAWDPDLRRTVALKQIRSAEGANDGQIERFVREAQLAARLRHPAIVAIHEIGDVDGVRYYTSEYVPGATLESAMRAAVSPRQAAEWIRSIALALAYAHAQGVVHRDVKPGNVLIDEQGGLHVADFGLAKDVDVATGAGRGTALTVSGEVMGTPAYMSPEQAEGRLSAIGPASDQFSLGAVLYEMLAGRTPFHGSGLVEVLKAVIEADPPRPSTLRGGVPADVETICLKSLEKDPARRYASLDDLAADLGRFLAGEPVLARPVPAVARLLRRAARHKAVSAAVLLSALLCAAFFVRVAWERLDRTSRVRAGLAEATRLEAEGDAPAALASRKEAYSKARDALAGVFQLDRDNAEAARARERIEARLREIDSAETAEAEAAALRKGDVVLRVLVRWSALSPTVHRIEAIANSSDASSEEKRAGLAREWIEVQRFIAETPDDAASQATMWPFAGLVKAFAGGPDEGIAWMRRGAELDPDLPFGSLSEALLLLARYVRGRPVATVEPGIDGPTFGPPPPEPPVLVELRERASVLLDRASHARVWGTERSRDTRALLDSLLGLRAADHAAADEALTRAIASPDFDAIRTALLEMRSQVRYARKKFAEALADVDAILQVRPRYAPALYLRASLGSGIGTERLGRGEDAMAAFQDAADDASRAIELDPSRGEYYVARVDALVSFAEAAAERDADRSDALRRAMEDFQAIDRLGYAHPAVANRRAMAEYRIAVDRAEKGEDAREGLARALALVEGSGAAGPEGPLNLVNRAHILAALGDAEAHAGLDPRERYRAAIASLTEAIGAGLADYDVYFSRATAHMKLAVAEEWRKEDPAPSFGRALADFDGAIERAGSRWRPLLGKADCLAAMGRVDEAFAAYDAVIAAVPDAALKSKVVESRERLRRRAESPWLAKAKKAYEAVDRGDYAAARRLYEEALSEADAATVAAAGGAVGNIHHDLACVYALLSDGRTNPSDPPAAVEAKEAARLRDLAFTHLTSAIRFGWRDRQALEEDADLAPIRSDPRFAEAMGSIGR